VENASNRAFFLRYRNRVLPSDSEPYPFSAVSWQEIFNKPDPNIL
jgi:hypothetical protein